jgi:uncharacterized protein (DUF1697 family)
MTRYVVLLRGVNLGPHRRVPMADLRALLGEAGHGDVRTLLASGNVVLTSDLEPDALRRDVEERMAARFGMEVPVVVRTRDELAAVVADHPLRDVADEPRRLQVTFLSEPVDATAVRELEALAVAPEALVVRGRELHTWHPDGIGRSALALALTRRPARGVVATSRNWATVTKLLALADGSV